MGLLDLFTGKEGNDVAEKAESKFGINKKQIIALLIVATPLVISYLRKKANDKNEAEALDKALEKDHDGSILNNLSAVEEKEQEGNSILGHIFGNDKPQVENELSEKTGISLSKIGPILAMAAPIIMGFIGKEKRANNVNSGRLGDLLGNVLGGNSSSTQNTITDLLGSVLGGNKNKKGGSGIDDLLGNIFGK